MSINFALRLACSIFALPLSASAVIAQPKPSEPPPLVIVTGVIKEVNAARKRIVYYRVAEGSYGPQQVTDLMLLHDKVTISLNGIKVPLADLRPGDRVVFECLPKPERALRVAALSPEELERVQKEKDQIKEYEKKVEADHLRLIKELARKQLANEAERAKAKARASAEKAKNGADKKDDPMKKDDPTKDRPKKDPPN